MILDSPFRSTSSFLFLVACILGADTCHGVEVWKPKKLLTSLPIADDQRGLTVPVRIDGRLWEFSLDTGSTVSIIDSQLKSLLGRPIASTDVRTPNESRQLSLYEAPRMTCGSVNVTLPKGVLCLDLSGSRAHGYAPIYGILGLDWLSQFTIHIDWDNGIVQVAESEFQNDRPPGERIEVILEEGRAPKLDIRFGEDVDVRAKIDTGMKGGSLINAELAARLVEERRAKQHDVQLQLKTVFNSTATNSLVRCNQLRIGRLQSENIVFVANDVVDKVVLGVNYWRRFRVTLCLEHREMYLLPSDQFGLHDHGDSDGISTAKAEGSVRIAHVDKGGIAYARGVRAGDVIVAVANVPAENLTQYDVYRRLIAPRRDDLVMILFDGERNRTVKLSAR